MFVTSVKFQYKRLQLTAVFLTPLGGTIYFAGDGALVNKARQNVTRQCVIVKATRPPAGKTRSTDRASSFLPFIVLSFEFLIII